MSLARHLTKAIKGQAKPLFIFSDTVIPGASLYWAVRLWEKELQSLSLPVGARLAVAARPSVAFLALLLASLRRGYTFCPLPEKEPHVYLGKVDPTLFLDLSCEEVEDGTLPKRLPPKRKNSLPLYPEISLLLLTSGSTGERKIVAISEGNLLAVLASHLPKLGLAQARLLSLLPWSHCFGLVLELLAGILAQSTFVRPPLGARDPEMALSWAQEYHCNGLFAVPLMIERLYSCKAGEGFLRKLTTGVVGGAPVSQELCEKLRGSRLRIGYGQTEASPGITLGKVGFFQPNYLGQPVGCETRLFGKKLFFRGKNRALGYFTSHGLQLFEDLWHNTGDFAQSLPEGLYFLGRGQGEIKLSNGRFFPASFLESLIQKEVIYSCCVLVSAHPQEGILLFISEEEAKLEVQEKIVNLLKRHFPKIRAELRYCPREHFVRDNKGALLRQPSLEKILSHECRRAS
ncbi:MAG: acyl--CoA ligase [Leptospiraceae bacterium]|nr:acyl--CoA ligase [Leptospiraceae bacterium]MDW8306692.1 class I adenylate-forming enzyme family protein [Leptospiraceae bacterium]